MQLKRLLLSQFRSYPLEEVFFESKINCIYGANAEGKSNLLEAIYLLSTGKSFRTSRLQELIRHGQEGFRLEAHFIKEEVQNTVRLSFNGKERRLFYNETSYTSFLPLLGLFPFVLVAPEDIIILTGGPLERRRFLDLHLAQIDPLYISHLGRYHQALKQRNHLLKFRQEKGLSPWEHILATSATYLVAKRQEAASYFQKSCQEILAGLFDLQDSSFLCRYESSLSPTSSYQVQWERMRKKELALATTLIGPHRDDLTFLFQNQEAKRFCSEGQKRSCLLALKLAEWQRIREIHKVVPLFGIDDFGIHLDAKRLSLIKELLASKGQVFLTAPSFSDFPSHKLWLKEGTLFKHGEMSKVSTT